MTKEQLDLLLQQMQHEEFCKLFNCVATEIAEAGVEIDEFDENSFGEIFNNFLRCCFDEDWHEVARQILKGNVEKGRKYIMYLTPSGKPNFQTFDNPAKFIKETYDKYYIDMLDYLLEHKEELLDDCYKVAMTFETETVEVYVVTNGQHIFECENLALDIIHNTYPVSVWEKEITNIKVDKTFK